MGFGSYDESEQENQALSTEDDSEDEAVEKGTEYQGSIEFEEEDTDTLLEQFKNDVKEDEEDEE